jgi:hypothetical protein
MQKENLSNFGIFQEFLRDHGFLILRPVGRNRSVSKSIGNAAHIEQTLGSLLYECASHEKLDVLPFW